MSVGPRRVSDEEMAEVMRWRTDPDLVVRVAGTVRLAEVVQAAVESGRPVRANWRNTVDDVLEEAWKGLDRTQHPDDHARYASIISSLAGLWLSVEECDAIYLDGREP